MDSIVQLSIIEKSKQVFSHEKEDIFLSFPNTAISFKKSDLIFDDDEEDFKADKNQISEFSRMVNQIPRGELWASNSESYLWNIYKEILGKGQVARAFQTSEEGEEYSSIVTLLYDNYGKKNQELSRKYLIYCEFKDAYYVLKEQYASRKIDVELSGDEKEKLYWEKTENELWRRKFKEIEDKWISRGYKYEIDDALQRKASIERRAPQSTWIEWQKLFVPDADIENDYRGYPYVDTRYAPSNAIDEGAWSEFAISKNVAKSLISGASSQFKKIFLPDGLGVPSFESIKLEFSSVKVCRPWFESSVFRSRFFKYGEIISTGGDKIEGLCPAYVTGLIFARNVEVRMKVQENDAGSSSEGGIESHIEDMAKSFNFGPLGKVTLSLGLGGDKSEEKSRLTPQDGGHSMLRHILDSPLKIKNERKIVRGRRRSNSVTHATLTSGYSVQLLYTVQPKAELEKVLKSDPEDVYILGFICRRNPRCPNPDPDLKWE